MSADNEYEIEGGCAFPFTAQGVGGETNEADPGMTLRDYFAGRALAGICAMSGEGFSLSPQDEAAWAYDRADAMIAARKVKQ